MLVSWIFIPSYTIIYFFVRKFLFSNVYISSEYYIQISFCFFGWERGRQLGTYATFGGWSVIQNACSCVQGEGVSRVMCTYSLTFFLFMFSCSQFSCLIVSCFICRILTLLLFKKDVFIRKGFLSPTRSILSSLNKLFSLKIFIVKVSQNAFNFNLREP